MLDFADEGIAVAGVRGPLRLEDMLFMAKKANRIAPLQVLRADRVVSADHLRSAALHARRAFDEGRNQADRLEVEFTRYAAGERQIKKALAKLGVEDGSPAGVVCALGDKRRDALEYFVDGLGLVEDDTLIDGGLAALHAFGVTEAELEATPEAHHLDIVLEHVAEVDLMRK